MQKVRINREYNPVRELASKPAFGFVIVVLLHPVLALAMRVSSVVSTLHALLTLSVGILVALFSKDKIRVGYVAAYITGSEVLWRMTGANIFWEAGKYFTIIIFAIALLRIKPLRKTILPIIYFFLLCLSIPLTISALGISGSTQEAISFNLSGPLALMVCVIYFSQITIKTESIEYLSWWVIAPVLSIATLALYGIFTGGIIVFTGESNFATSGGFGPNQVSAALGLGGGLALILFLLGKGTNRRLIALVFGLGLLILSVLTFSRGGLYNVAVMLFLAIIHYIRSARGRVLGILGLLLVALVSNYLILPKLDSFTGGMLIKRFSDLDTTLRGQIAQVDINLWLENPILGVGPGMAEPAREIILSRVVAAHTEYTRALAEHGIAGLLSLFVLLVLAIRAYFAAPNLLARTWVVTLLAWPFMEMAHSDMRVVAISFLFGLAMINWKGISKFSENQRLNS